MQLIAVAAGDAVARFGALLAAAERLGARLDESAVDAATVRVAVTAGPVTRRSEPAREGWAALGSAVARWAGSPPADLGDAVACRWTDGGVAVHTGSGNHRWYVVETEDGLLACTHLRPLASSLGEDLALDRSYEDFLLGYGFLPDGRTTYQGVRQLGPGERAAFGAQPGARAPDPVTPADVDVDPSDPAAVSSAIEERLLRAVEEQAGTQRHHALLLGGFDSALVGALLRHIGHRVDTFTFSFGDERYEQRNAELIARHLDAQHHWVRFTPEVMGDLLLRFDELVTQPGPQPHYQLFTWQAAAEARALGFQSVFTGDGCDATFLGHPTTNQRASVVDRVAGLPAPLRALLTGALRTRLAERHLGHVARLARYTLHEATLAPPARGHLPSRYLDDHALGRARPGPPPGQAESIEELRGRLAAPVASLHPTRRAYHGHGLTAQSRAKVEAAVTWSGLPQVTPFAHPSVRSLAMALPVEALRPPGEDPGSPGKAALLRMARQRRWLPDAVLDMPKQSPVDSPMDHWYAGPLRPVAEELLAGLPFEVDPRFVRDVLRPKRAEEAFRERLSIGHYAFQALALLCTYGAFTRRARG